MVRAQSPQERAQRLQKGWPSTPKDTIRLQSENVLKEDLTEDHILLCAKVPEISRRTVEIIKRF